jgi:hypothetical protein
MKATNAATDLCLADQIAVLAAQVDVGTHRLLTCIRRFDESEEWGHQGARTCADWLAWRIGLTPGAAREKVRVARALGRFPAIDAAMADGRLSYAKARALTRVATAANEATLVQIALAATGAQLERLHAGRARDRPGPRGPARVTPGGPGPRRSHRQPVPVERRARGLRRDARRDVRRERVTASRT